MVPELVILGFVKLCLGCVVLDLVSGSLGVITSHLGVMVLVMMVFLGLRSYEFIVHISVLCVEHLALHALSSVYF